VPSPRGKFAPSLSVSHCARCCLTAADYLPSILQTLHEHLEQRAYNMAPSLITIAPEMRIMVYENLLQSDCPLRLVPKENDFEYPPRKKPLCIVETAIFSPSAAHSTKTHYQSSTS
jgi:hypothetical protein